MLKFSNSLRVAGAAIAVQADIAEPDDVKRLFEEAIKTFGNVDVVVNNGGIMPLSPIGKGDVEVFDKVICTNLRGTFLVLSHATQHVAAGGRINTGVEPDCCY
jgi:3-oxoacyl-[acyl-carrier protein] reductase